MQKINLDRKDKKIINELDMGARQSYSQIGRKVGLTKDTIQYRINRLEKLNVIENYFAAVDISKLGYTFYRICLKFRNLSLNKEKEIIKHLKSHISVGWISIFSGRWDIIMGILARNMVEFEEILSPLLSKYEKYFQEKIISTIISIYHFKNKILTETKSAAEFVLGGDKKQVKVDEIDLKILSLLADNARIRTIDISKQLKITANAVKNRIKRLIKEKIILGFRAKLNEKLLGFYHYKIFLHLQNFTKEKEKLLINFLKFDPRVIYITKAIGIAELEFEILVEDIEDFYELIKEIRMNLGDVLKDYETVLVYEENYIRYFQK